MKENSKTEGVCVWEGQELHSVNTTCHGNHISSTKGCETVDLCIHNINFTTSEKSLPRHMSNPKFARIVRYNILLVTKLSKVW